MGRTGTAMDVVNAFRKLREPPLVLTLSHYEVGVPVYKIPQGATGLEIPKSWVPQRRRNRG